MPEPLIRLARPGDEAAIHESHMRSIREVCIKDHGPDEIRGWGNRTLDNRWTDAIQTAHVWVVESNEKICGHGFLRIYEKENEKKAYVHGLYLTPEVLGKGCGQKLARLMLEKAREAGAKIVALESTITAHGFYKSLGFVDVKPMERIEVGGSLVRCFPMALQLEQ